MKVLPATLLLAAVSITAPGKTVSYVDPFGTAATSCLLPVCDVIGNPRWFDLETMSMTLVSDMELATFTSSLNFGPVAGGTLRTFRDHDALLNPADVLISVGGVVRYGIAITSHENGLQAGHLYEVLAPGGVLTALDVLQLGSGYAYRPDQPVWLTSNGGYLRDIGAGTVSVARTGDGVHHGAKTVTVSFMPTTAFAVNWNSGEMSIAFASATCGNDLAKMLVPLSARVPLSTGPGNDGTPEPGSWAMMLIGGGLMAAANRRLRGRRGQRRQSAG